VVDVDVNPNKTTEFYVAYASGGLWYTNNKLRMLSKNTPKPSGLKAISDLVGFQNLVGLINKVGYFLF